MTKVLVQAAVNMVVNKKLSITKFTFIEIILMVLHFSNFSNHFDLFCC